jgi:hypothetical protein
VTRPSKPAVDVDEPASQDADGVVGGGHDQTASTLGVVLAQTAGSSDLDGVAGAVELGGHDVDAANGSDLTAGVVLVDEPAAWPGQLIGAFGGVSTVGTISTNAEGGVPSAGWQRVATGFLLGYAGASRAAYAADLRDYLTWWADTATPDHPADSGDSGDGVARSPGASSSPGSRSRDGHGGDPLAARRADVDAYAGALREAGASPATIGRRLATLSGFYGYAVDDQLIDRSPTARVRRPTVGEHAVSTACPATSSPPSSPPPRPTGHAPSSRSCCSGSTGYGPPRSPPPSPKASRPNAATAS